MRETLGNRISKKLKEYGISQRLLATLTRTTEVSVSRYVNDKRIPKADVLYRIACSLHTTTDYLLGLTTSEQTNEEWLRQCTTDEMVKTILDLCDYRPCFACGIGYCDDENWCHVYSDEAKEFVVEWLKQPRK